MDGEKKLVRDILALSFWTGGRSREAGARVGSTVILLARYKKQTNTYLHRFEINQFETPEHKGTHLDSPCHFNEYGWRVHQIPPSNLVGPAVVIDIRGKVSDDHDYLFSINDVKVGGLHLHRMEFSVFVCVCVCV